MNINYLECTCPNCGAKTKEGCNTWAYGSPIRKCKSCNSEYLDKRWREVAVEGFDPRAGNADFYLKGTVGFIVFTAVCALLLIWMAGTSGHYPLKLAACVFGGILGTVLCGVMFLRIKLGFEDKNNDAFMEESKMRLRDPEYIRKLEEHGYTVPDEFKG